MSKSSTQQARYSGSYSLLACTKHNEECTYMNYMVHIVHFTQCIVHCTVCSVHCTLYTVHDTKYIVHCALHRRCDCGVYSIFNISVMHWIHKYNDILIHLVFDFVFKYEYRSQLKEHLTVF